MYCSMLGNLAINITALALTRRTSSFDFEQSTHAAVPQKPAQSAPSERKNRAKVRAINIGSDGCKEN